MKRYIIFIYVLAFFVMSYNYSFAYEENDDKQIIANTQTDLIGGEIDGISVCRVYETNMGDLVADALHCEAKDKLIGTEYENLPVVSIQNGGGIRTKISAGDITRKQIKEMFPYGNRMVLYKITPNILYEILENGVSKIKRSESGGVSGIDGRFPQISGIKFIYDYSQKAYSFFEDKYTAGKRILTVYSEELGMNFNRDDNKTPIILAFNDYCMDGRDGYQMLKNTDVIYHGRAIDDIVCDYLYEISNFNTKSILYYTNGRIKIGERLNDDSKTISAYLNLDKIEFDVLPTINNYNVMIPLRKLLEMGNIEVTWDKDTNSVRINDDNIININIISGEVDINGNTVSQRYKIYILDGRTMVTIDFIKDILGFDAEWDSKYSSVYIYN